MRRFSSVVWAVSLFSGAGVVSANQINVAVLSAIGNTGFTNNAVTSIQNGSSFLNVSWIDVYSLAPPDLLTLDNYAAVMVVSNLGFQNPAGLGDVLKSYVDQGHGVVIAEYTNSTTQGPNTELAGGFAASDYWAIEPGPTTSNPNLTLGIVHVANSPLLNNVHTLNGGTGAAYVNSTVNAAATDVIDWSNGLPLVATRTIGSGTVVGLNMYPPNNQAWSGLWLSTGDGGKLMADALLYAGGYSQDSGSSIPEGGTLMLSGVGLAAFSLVLKRRA